MKIRMVQQMSGSRADGSMWPGPGGTLEVSDEEGMALCRVTDGNPYPIAVPVPEKRQAEATAETKAETRPAPEDPAVEVRSVTEPPPWDEPMEDPPPPKRGPGRPRKDSLPK